MKNYGKKALSVLLAVLMCLTVVALDFSSLTAEAYTDSPTHTFKLRVRQTGKDSGYDGQDGGGQYTLYGKSQNGNGSQATISSGGLGTGWATKDGGTTDIGTFTSAYWPTSINIGCNICNNNSMFYKSQTIWAAVDISVYNAATGAYTDWVNFSNFSLSSSTKSGGGGSTYKNATSSNVGVYPYAAKVATSAGANGNATDTVNITLNATGGASKTQSFNAYVYDQYNVIWRTAPSSWSKSGTTACTTSLSTTGASESCTLTMSATNSTYQKATCTVKATYGSMYHQWNVVITPTYKVNFNVSTNGGTSTAPGSVTVTNTNTGSTSTSYTLQSSQTASKTNNTTGTWTFVGWNGSSSATTGTKPTSSITIDSYNDTLYAIFSRSATAKFHWYQANGQVTSSSNSKTVYNNATKYTFDVPKSSVPTSITVNGTTFTFAGWALDSTTKTTADLAATATTVDHNINTASTCNFYALYTGKVTLSFNNNGGSGLPAAQEKNLTLNCGANNNAASNESGKATFTINPNNVAMTRQYASDFIGWNTTAKDDETAQYKDGTVTWSASSSLPSTITIWKDTTLYASYYFFRYNVKFYDYKGMQLKEQTVKYNTSATAPTMKTNPTDPSHTDTGSHYVFDHWEYTDGSSYANSQKLVNATNGYTYDVWGKYVGHKHIWGDPYGFGDTITTCTTSATYYMKCTVCGYERQFEEEPLGHSYQVIGVAEPTCTKDGSYGKKVCIYCNEPDPTYAVEMEVEENGELVTKLVVVTDENRVRPALGHAYGIENLDKDEHGFYILKDTDGTYFVDPIRVEPTCTTAGYYYYECARCGDKYRVENLPATGHKWKTVEEIPATCTAGGHTGYTYCENENCGLFLEGVDEDTEALGHDYVLVEETDSTCTVKGHYAYYECSRCGKFFKLEADGETYTEITDLTVMDKPYAPHDYQFVDHVSATCTQPGFSGAYLCSVCGERDPETEPGAETPALGHVWERADFEGFATYADVYGAEYVEAYISEQPCVDPSSVTYTCPACGETYVMTDELADHTPIYHEDHEPTCSAEGNIEYWTCDVCGKYFSDEACRNEITLPDTVIAALPHTIITIDGQAPTCTADGIPDCYKCTVCEKLFVDAQGKTELTGELGIIPALGHNWTSWVTAVFPTDTEPGLEKRKCIRCGKVEERDIAATGHNLTFVAEKAATCTEPGNVAYYACDRCGRNYADEEGNTEIANVVVAALGHNLPAEPTETEAATCAAEGYNKYVCSRCNHTVIETIPKLSDHGTLIPYGENRPATCAAPGMEAGTMCSVCGEVITQPRLLAKLPHTAEAAPRDVIDVTCTVNGYTGDTYCAVCGQLISSGSVVEASGHHLGLLEVKTLATCTEYGTKVRKCADCDYEETVETPVLGHQIVTDKAVAATCTAAGLTEGKHCSRCNAVLTAQEEVPATGHSYSSTVVEPTCTKVGYTEYVCANCGDTYKENYTDKVAHVVGTPATCTSPAVCANCGRPFGTTIDHIYECISNTDSTCTVPGVRTYKCTMCGDTYTETKELIGHRLTTEGSYGVEPTCTERGYSAMKCEMCGEYIIEYDDAPLGHNYVDGKCTRCGETDPNYVPPTPADSGSEKCEKCGLNHNGRTGLWKQDGFFCKLLGFFRSIIKLFSR